ncbi:unnamed protein product [Leuciscus chuanchicus]
MFPPCLPFPPPLSVPCCLSQEGCIMAYNNPLPALPSPSALHCLSSALCLLLHCLLGASWIRLGLVVRQLDPLAPLRNSKPVTPPQPWTCRLHRDSSSLLLRLGQMSSPLTFGLLSATRSSTLLALFGSTSVQCCVCTKTLRTPAFTLTVEFTQQ